MLKFLNIMQHAHLHLALQHKFSKVRKYVNNFTKKSFYLIWGKKRLLLCPLQNPLSSLFSKHKNQHHIAIFLKHLSFVDNVEVPQDIGFFILDKIIICKQ